MNNNSDNKDILYEIIGGFEDELVEKAADYKKSSRILSFPIYRYVNAVAAFLICLISAVVFVQLKPINEIDETLVISTNQPKITAAPKPTDEPVETMLPIFEVVETETPSASLNPEKLPVATLRPMQTKGPVITVAPTKKPIVVVKPASTIKPIIRPTKAPVETPIVIRTPEPGAIVTATPDLEPVPTETNVPVPTAPITTTEPPVRTIEPTDVPPVVTVEPTNTPPVRTVEPTNTPPVVTVEPTNTPPVVTVEPTNTPPVRTVEPTEVSPIITDMPTTPEPTHTPEPIQTETPEPTMVPTPTVEPTLRPTALPLNIEDCTAVEGKPVTIKRINGAVYDEDTDIIEFTKESENNEKGVEIVNPIAGNESMIADYGYLMDIDTNGLLNAFHLSGSSLGWGTDGEKLPIPETQYVNGKPMYGGRDNRLYRRYADTNSVYYPKPESKVGFSICFWANVSRFNGAAPAVTFMNSYHCVVVRINGSVDYRDMTDSNNKFTASIKTGADYGEWHYYTITFANDWITYYVDGVEVPYDNVELDAIYIKSFNDGFLTRYNPSVGWNKEDISNDWRGYLNQQISEVSNITRTRYTVIDNSRYMGINNTKKLLLSFMASEETRVLLGGGYAGYYHNIAVYWKNDGTKYAQVKYYDVELTNKNVYANYYEALKSKPD